jgi:hypothetical protein
MFEQGTTSEFLEVGEPGRPREPPAHVAARATIFAATRSKSARRRRPLCWPGLAMAFGSMNTSIGAVELRRPIPYLSP